MTTWCLEMRNTQEWSDVRYREYTQSAVVMERFKTVPKIRFTDSSHGVVPVVSEHSGRRLPPIRDLADHVLESIKKETVAPVSET
jgi:hypothetical protein